MLLRGMTLLFPLWNERFSPPGGKDSVKYADQKPIFIHRPFLFFFFVYCRDVSPKKVPSGTSKNQAYMPYLSAQKPATLSSWQIRALGIVTTLQTEGGRGTAAGSIAVVSWLLLSISAMKGEFIPK